MISVVVPLYNEGERVLALLDHLRAVRGLAETVLVDASDEAASTAVVEALAGAEPMELTEPTEPTEPMELKEMETSAAAAPSTHENRPPAAAPIRLLRHPAAGRAAQMNAGAAACGGEVLLFLHCDTRLPRRAAARIAAAVNRGRRWGWFDVRLDARGPAYRVLERMICLRARASRIATGDMALFVQRRLFMAEGGFAAIPLMEDVELSRRLKRAGRPAVIADPAVTSARRWRQNGLVRTVLLMWKLRFLYWRGRDPARLAAAYGEVRDAG